MNALAHHPIPSVERSVRLYVHNASSKAVVRLQLFPIGAKFPGTNWVDQLPGRALLPLGLTFVSSVQAVPHTLQIRYSDGVEENIDVDPSTAAGSKVYCVRVGSRWNC